MSAKDICDGCRKERYDVKPCRDRDGNADGPAFCFVCRKEWERNQRVFDTKLQKYIQGD